MKNLYLAFLSLSIALTSLTAIPAYSHVIPEDELRNQGPTASTQALNQAVHKILILHKVLYLNSRN